MHGTEAPVNSFESNSSGRHSWGGHHSYQGNFDNSVPLVVSPNEPLSALDGIHTNIHTYNHRWKYGCEFAKTPMFEHGDFWLAK